MAKSIIVVTGAAGMIGSGIVRHLNDLGETELVLVDDLGFGEKWKNLLGKRFIDILHPSKLFDFLANEKNSLKAIIHMGACSDTTETDADYLIENNLHFTTRLAKIALEVNARFIYASSAATYGDGSAGFTDDASQLETLRPLNMYGFSKHLTDLWMKREGVLDKVVALKYFNIFGPNEDHKGKMCSFIFKKTKEANEKGTVSLFKSNDLTNFADGEQSRDFLYVKDAVKMTCAFLEKEVGGIYNIGLGKVTTWNEMAGHLFDVLGKKGKISYVDMPQELKEQYQNYTCADMGKFHKTFSKMQLTSMSAAVRDYVQNYLLTKERW